MVVSSVLRTLNVLKCGGDGVVVVVGGGGGGGVTGMRFGRGRCEVKSKWGCFVGWLAGLLVTSFQRSGDGSGSWVTDPHHRHHPDPPGLGLGQNRGRFPAGIAIVVLGQLFGRPPEKKTLGLKGLELLRISSQHLVSVAPCCSSRF